MTLSPGTKLKVFAVIISNLGIVFIVISCATNSWSTTENHKIKSSQGLWYKCTTRINSTEDERCQWIFEKLFNESGLFQSIAVLLLLCGVLQAVSVLASVCSHYAQYEVVRLLFILEFLTGLLSLTSYFIYYVFSQQQSGVLAWSHYLGTSGAAMIIVGSILLIVGHEKPKLFCKRY